MLVQATNGNDIGISIKTKFRWSHTTGEILNLNTSIPTSFFPLPFCPPPFLFHSHTPLFLCPFSPFPHPSFSLSLVYWLAGPEFGTWRVHPWYPASFGFCFLSSFTLSRILLLSPGVEFHLWQALLPSPPSYAWDGGLGSPINMNSYINKADHCLASSICCSWNVPPNVDHYLGHIWAF